MIGSYRLQMLLLIFIFIVANITRSIDMFYGMALLSIFAILVDIKEKP